MSRFGRCEKLLVFVTSVLATMGHSFGIVFLETIQKGRLQNFRDFLPAPSPCPHFGLISSTKSTQPLLLGQPPSLWSRRPL